MKKYIEFLKDTALFKGIETEEIALLLGCLGAKVKNYKKDEYVLNEGEVIKYVSLLLEGSLHIQRDDYWGNRSIINVIKKGEIFGEAYISQKDEIILNDVIATKDSTIISFDIQKILTTCPSTCKFHNMLIQNLFFSISEKNRSLVRKLGHMAKRSTREKLISYLSEEAKKQNSADFLIPFNRQQLADFLSVDRSAMSNELCKMRDEGLVIFKKNNFILKHKE